MVKEVKPRVCVVTGYGINADQELQEAFSLCGADARRVHLQDLVSKPEALEEYHILAFPGGFSFGDHLGSGLVVAGIIKRKLSAPIKKFLHQGKPILGICNGFQILVKSGILPNLSGTGTQEVSLIQNASGSFIDTWVEVRFNRTSPCIWTKDLETMDLPIRHGEGRFVAPEPVIKELVSRNLVTLSYSRMNPNGSAESIAGITDPRGLILGLMPHPEAFMFPHNHPLWMRKPVTEGFGLRILKRGVDYAIERMEG